MFAIGQSNFLQALGWAVLNSLWQMALLWVVYQLITAVFRKASASQKNTLATAMLFTGFAWFAFTFFITLKDAADTHAGYAAFLTLDRNEGVNSWLYTILPIASLAYLVLLILPVLNFIRNYRYVQVIRKYGLIKADVQWRMFVQNVSARLGVKKPVHVWLSELVKAPVTIGFLRPIILLPVAAVNHLTADQVEAVLLHELSHIRRFDFLLNLISKAIQTILYFNPFVKAFARIIETEREKNCDEIVLQFQYEPHGYAAALLTLEKATHPTYNLAVAASGVKKQDLLTRIETIMGIRKKQVVSLHKLAGVLGALFCFISLNVLILLSKPGESKIKPGFLTDMSVPFHLFTPAIDRGQALEIPPPDASQGAGEIEIVAKTIVNKPGSTSSGVEKESEQVIREKIESELTYSTTSAAPKAENWPYTYVSIAEDIIPELAPEEQQQVEKALEASKKVMAEDQWGLVEKGIADAMTSNEKEKLKSIYKKAMNKVDWEKMEERLKLSYEQINWNQVNLQLKSALAEIQLDSLQKAYTATISELAALEKELKEANQPGIPDSGITLRTLNNQKREAQRVINTIKSVRHRKIVHL